MDCEVSTNYSTAQTTTAAAATNGQVNGRGGGITSNGNGSSPISTSSSRNSSGSTKSQLHVDFIESNGEVKEKREKYLTAKYGSHQMNLIRKRLAVEMWLYDEIQKLFEVEQANGDSSTKSSSIPFSSTPEIEIDLDEVLDIDGENERRKFIKSLLIDVNKSPEVVNKFIEDVLEKARTL